MDIFYEITRIVILSIFFGGIAFLAFYSLARFISEDWSRTTKRSSLYYRTLVALVFLVIMTVAMTIFGLIAFIGLLLG